jgi:tetratricopeptide (TPR) repeat protein
MKEIKLTLFLSLLAAAAQGQDCVTWLNQCKRVDEPGCLEAATKALETWSPDCGSEVKGKAYYNRGSAYVTRKEFERGLADLNRAVELVPGHANAWANRASALASLGRHGEAVSDMNRALELGPDDKALTYYHRALSHAHLKQFPESLKDINAAILLNPGVGLWYQVRAQTNKQLNNQDEIPPDLDKALALDPTLLLPYMMRSGIRHKRRDYAGALADDKRAALLQPYDLDAWTMLFNASLLADDCAETVEAGGKLFTLAAPTAERLFQRGRCYYRLGRAEEALADFKAAAEKGADIGDLEYYTALTLRDLSRFGEAHQILKKAITKNPKDASLRIAQGFVYKGEKNYESALRAFKEAASLKPDLSDPYRQQGHVYSMLKQSTMSLTSFAKAIERQPSADLYLSRGLAYDGLGDLEKALADYDKAIELSTGLNGVHRTRALARLRTGKLTEALADVDFEIAADSAAPMNYTTRGLIFVRQERYSDAITEYEKAMALDPKSALPFRLRASSAFELDRFESALADYDMAISLGASDPLIHRGRGRALAALGKFEDAVAAFDKSIAIQPSAPAYAFRGMAAAELGRSDAAERDSLQAVGMAPADAMALIARAVVLSKAGDLARARDSFKKAAGLNAQPDQFIKKMKLTPLQAERLRALGQKP